MAEEIDDEILEELYAWIDEIPLTRPKKDIRRDFADGVLVAEVVKYYCPRIVDLHNYQPASKINNRVSNWTLLSRKVFKKLGFELGDDVIKNISGCQPFAIEQFLMLLRRKIDRCLYENKRTQLVSEITPTQEPVEPVVPVVNDQPEADQGIHRTTVNIAVPPEPRQPPHKPGHSKGKFTKITPGGSRQKYSGEMVPKLLVEEKEQELLTKDETIQILQAKVRRLEHLLHLKDIRVDDLTLQLNSLEHRMRPTMQIRKPQVKQVTKPR